jgi:choline dehydrogenase-like flavoprotein
MLIDFREYDSTDPIECDICIVGGGAAGVTIARTLAGSSLSVVLLESGGLDPDFDTQMLANYKNVGDYLIEMCRLRFLGGTTNHWRGASAPFSALDMSVRSWVPDSGWPIGRQDLEPYYRASHELLELGNYEYGYPLPSNEAWRFPDYENGLVNRLYRRRLTPINFGTDFREELDSAANVRLLYNAIVVNINANANADSIETVSIRTHEGKTNQVRAKRFVLAVGAMETPRMLLLSNDVQQEGLGNGNDMVGRYFMMHPHANIGTVAYDSSEFAAHLTRGQEENVDLISIVGFSELAQAQKEVLSASVQTVLLPDPDSGRAAAKRIAGDLKKLDWPDDFGEELMRVLMDLDDIAADAFGSSSSADSSGSARLWVQSEQSPNPDSRVMLDTKTDALGMRKTVVDCRLHEIDHKTIRMLGEIYGSETARLGLGRVKLEDWVIADSMSWPANLSGGCHHLGSARMSADPAKGVVDVNCQVHGINNLHIASSAVFPAGSDVNPTMTIVALSLRLTNYLQQVL